MCISSWKHCEKTSANLWSNSKVRLKFPILTRSAWDLWPKSIHGCDDNDDNYHRTPRPSPSLVVCPGYSTGATTMSSPMANSSCTKRAASPPVTSQRGLMSGSPSSSASRLYFWSRGVTCQKQCKVTTVTIFNKPWGIKLYLWLLLKFTAWDLPTTRFDIRAEYRFF